MTLESNNVNTRATNPSDNESPNGPTRPAAIAPGSLPVNQPMDLWRMTHRALRGHYRIACILGAAGAIAGCGTGWMMGKRLYTSTGLVRIASVLPQVMRETDQNKPIAMFDGIIQAQRDLMASREMILAAMKDNVWQQGPDGSNIPSEEEFAAGLKVETRQRSDHLRVNFTSKDPAVAANAVRSIVAAFQKAFTNEQTRVENARLDQLTARRASLKEESQKIHEDMRQIADGRTAAELEPLCAAAADRVKKLRAAVADVQLAQDGGPDLVQRQTMPARSPGQAVSDDILRSYAMELVRVENQLAETKSKGFGPAHPTVQRYEGLVKEYHERVINYAKASDAARGGGVTAGTSKSLVERSASLQASAQAAEDSLKSLGAQRTQLTSLEERAATVEQGIRDTASRLDALAIEAGAGSRLTVVSVGDKPITAVLDNRAKAAAVGGFFGLALPLGALVLRGSFRRRYRFADEVAEDLAYRVPFVGILPEITTDPVISAVAAHGIHDLRVRLQPTSPAHPRTYVVTSASPSEGKSGLVVALAASFAAAGYRTLVIDADLATRTLTSGLDSTNSPGLSEAVGRNKFQLRQVRAGFSFLGAGRSGPRMACELSPISAARVLGELSDQFDVMLIDGDPILTGIRAAIFAPLVDGVILTVSRDQEQTQVIEAAKRIEMLGANISGVVFNRAPASDFRELARQQAHTAADPRSLPERLNRFGPLVGCTLASLSRISADDLDLLNDGFEKKGTDAARRAA